ncbi:MAG TPA: polysaccharide biosynthesis tyrosine autokinase [Tenuifilaceae bacterium]|nr:polysaccharide biosynthesis tyrosine autokinase [Tenuifilaceae bacterium]
MENDINSNKTIPQLGYPEEEQLDIKQLLFRVLANWYWFAISVFIALFVAYLVNRYTEQIYSVSSSVIVRDDDQTKSFVGAEQLIQGLRLTKNTKSVQNEIGILQSYSLARQTIEELVEFRITYIAVGRRGIKEQKLYKNAPFKVLLDTGAVNQINHPIYISILNQNEYRVEINDGLGVNQKLKYGEPFRHELFGFTVYLRNPGDNTDDLVGRKFYFLINDSNSLALAYKSKATISLNDKKGSILTLSSSGFVAEQEADYLNKLMEVYILRGLLEKNQIAANTVLFIDQQLESMTDSLRRAEQSLQDFRTANRVLDISREGNMLFDRIRVLYIDQSSFELKGRYYRYLKKYLDERSDLNAVVAPSAMGVDDPQLSFLLNEVSKAYVEREELRSTIKEGSPGLNQIEIRIGNLRNALYEKVTSLIESNRIAQEGIKEKQAQIEAEMRKLPINERLLIGFERDFGLIDKMYTYLQEKRAEAAIAQASNIADNKILDYAIPQNAAMLKPKKTMNYLVGLMAGLAIPFLIIILLDFFNDRIVDLKEISRKTRVPVIGTLGHNRYDTEMVVLEKPKSTLTESFRGLRTNLQYLLREPGKKVIAVSSTVVGEGKTFTAVNLAAIIAVTGKKVLLIGLDLRKPRLHRVVGYNGTVGVSTYLIGQNTPDDIIFQSSIDNLYFAPSGPIPPNPAELLGSERMEEFIVWAKENFDFIVIDSPPVAIVSDAFLIARFTDANLFVLRFGYSSKEVLNLLNDIYKHHEVKNLALVVNDFQPKRGYGYSYGYTYSYGYSYGYGYKHGYGYGTYSGSGYYSDEDEPRLSWKERFKKLF